MRGGQGTAALEKLPALFPNCRLGAIITLARGVSIGEHVHEGESELYYILEGTATYRHNQKESELFAGDFTICLPGEHHAITGTSETPCRLLALIVLDTCAKR